MQFKDYYKIMGVAETASADEIKSAYRKLARKYHPDVSKEKDAEERFKEMKEAYEVLKDPEKRVAYDKLRKGGWKGGEEFRRPSDWQQQWDFHGGGYTSAGSADFSDFFEELFGRRQGAGRNYAYRARGEDMQYPLEISLEEAFKGSNRGIQLRVPEIDKQGQVVKKTRTLNVKIPAGVTQGQLIRLANQGGAGQGGAPNGDLYLEIHIAPHSVYQLDGRNVSLTLPITPWEAALGAKVKVPTLGGTIEVTIPALSQTGTKLRLKGRGLPGNPAGDEFVILQVVIPKPTDEEAKNLYRQMAEKMPFNPRERLGV